MTNNKIILSLFFSLLLFSGCMKTPSNEGFKNPNSNSASGDGNDDSNTSTGQVNDKAISNIRLVWTSAPSTEIMVLWDSDNSNGEVVYYGLNSSSSTKGYPLHTTNVSNTRYGNSNIYLHKTLLSGLLPQTNYFFRVKNKDGMAKEFYFKTAPTADNRSNIKILMGGYAGNNSANADAINTLTKGILQNNPDILAFVHGGNYVDPSVNSATDIFAGWKKWLASYNSTFIVSTTAGSRIIPLIPVKGKYDNNDQFQMIFGLDSTFSTFSVGSALFFNLDTSSGNASSQASWMDSEMSSQSQQEMKWKVALYSAPAYPIVSTGVPSASAQWTSIFDKYLFDLAFEAETDAFKWTYPLTDGEKSSNGVIYLGDSGDGGMSHRTLVTSNPNPSLFEKVALGLHVYVLEASSSSMNVKTYATSATTATYTLNIPTKSGSGTPEPEPTPTPVSPCDGMSVTLYTDSYFNERSILSSPEEITIVYDASEGWLNLDGIDGAGDTFLETVSSLKVASGLSVDLSSKDDGEDVYETVTKDLSWFWLWDDNQARSIRLRCNL